MLFDKLFQKKISVVPEVIIRTTDYYTVISPDEIQALRQPPFEQGAYLSELDYKNYLEKVQFLFDEYETTGSIHEIHFDSIEDVAKKREEKRFLDNFRAAFLDCGRHINVGRTLDGTYKVVSNGRHRMYVAKKYNLRLLVHVAQEEVFNKG